MAAKSSSTSSSSPRLRWALLVAAGLVALANAWAGYRLPVALGNTILADTIELDRRLAIVPHKAQVQVLAFGNSHALAAFRPLQLAAALKRPPEQVFSLSIPASSIAEVLLGARDAWPGFPAVRVALIHVDESLILPAFEQDARLRYASRYSFNRRSHLLPWLSGDNRPVSLLSAWLPLFDQRVAFQQAWHSERERLVGVLANQDRPLPPGPNANVRATPYAWGYPPVWEIPGYFPGLADLQALKRYTDTASYRSERAAILTRYADRTAFGLNELESWCRLAEQHGARPVLVRLPYEPAFRRLLDDRYAPEVAAFDAAVAGYQAATGRQILTPPGPWRSEEFYDTDHMTPEGSLRIAAWLKSVL